MDRDNNFDLIRLFAALQVIYLHAIAHLSLPVGSSALLWFASQTPGVALFFGISGFLITQSLLRRPGPVYYLRARFLRIYPALWVSFVLILALMLWVGSIPEAGRPMDLQLKWLFLLFTLGSDGAAGVFILPPHNPGTFYEVFPDGALWTITVEIGFYLVMPIVLFLWRHMGKLGPLFLAALFAGSAYLQWLTVKEPSVTWYFYLHALSPFPYFWLFLVGAAAALYWPRLAPLFCNRALFWAVAYFAICYGYQQASGRLISDFYKPNIVIFLGTALLIAVGIACAFTRPKSERLRGIDLSYGIYLYHMPVIWTFKAAGYHAEGWLWVAVYGITLGLATVSWFLVERPALRLKGRAGKPNSLSRAW